MPSYTEGLMPSGRYDPRRAQQSLQALTANMVADPMQPGVYQDPRQSQYRGALQGHMNLENETAAAFKHAPDLLPEQLLPALQLSQQRIEQARTQPRTNYDLSEILPSRGVPATAARQFNEVPLPIVPELLDKAFPMPKPEPTMTPYQTEQIRLGGERNELARLRATQRGAPRGGMTQSEARLLYGQIFDQARALKSSGGPERLMSLEQLMKQLANENGVDLDELNRVRAGSVGMEEPQNQMPRLPSPAEQVAPSPERESTLTSAKGALDRKFGGSAGPFKFHAVNPQTGQRIVSNDGVNWQPAQ